jgi:uncharacterized membrane protein
MDRTYLVLKCIHILGVVMQARIARGFESAGPIPLRYWRLARIWMTFGVTATLLPLANLYRMVFKPT